MQLVVDRVDPAVDLVVDAAGDRRQPLLAPVVFFDELETCVEVVQPDRRRAEADPCLVVDRATQAPDGIPVEPIAELDPLPRAPRRGNRHQYAAVSKADKASSDGRTPDGFPVSRRVHDVGGKRGQHAAVSFNFVQGKWGALFGHLFLDDDFFVGLSRMGDR